MKKWILYAVLAILVGGSWWLFAGTGGDIREKTALLDTLMSAGDPEGKVPALQTEIQTLEGTKTFNGILLAFLSAGLIGIVFVFDILPLLAHKATHAIYDSAEMVEHDVMHDARSKLAQGDYEGAIESFRAAAEADPLNRLPWVEIAKIQKDNLHDPAAAIETIRFALESREWEVSDAAYFLFRLAELYDEVQGDRTSARSIMEQVIELFPSTRHSANARHRLHEWDAQELKQAEEAAVAQALAEQGAVEESASGDRPSV